MTRKSLIIAIGIALAGAAGIGAGIYFYKKRKKSAATIGPDGKVYPKEQKDDAQVLHTQKKG